MKSYFVDGLLDEASARNALSKHLPNWVDPWLMHNDKKDIVAFFTVDGASESGVVIQADISGRHFDADHKIIELLRMIRDELGDVITDHDGNAIA